MSLYNELKRRNVFRVGIAYLAGAWLLTEVSGTLFPAFGVPDWAIRFVVIVLILGFVPALIISWAYELTPEGLKREKDVVRDASIAHLTARRLDGITIGLIVAALVILAADRFWPGTGLEEQVAVPAVVATDGVQTQEPAATETQFQSNSIAVLPFVNMSSDPEQEYFSDGISEEILNVLTRIPNFKVAARTSSFQFKGKNLDIAEIGKKLQVNHLLEGSVRKSGDTLRITAQLIEVDTGFHLWSETFDRKLEDVFAIQDDIAAAIAVELRARLTDELDKPSTPVDLKAYELYLKGRGLVAARGEARLFEAIDILKAAIKIEPEYAPAIATLAKAYVVLPWFSSKLPAGEVREQARQWASRALEIEPQNAEALATLAIVYSQIDLNWAGARRLLERALQANPGSVAANNFQGDFATRTGDLENALKYESRAAELDPLGTVQLTDLANVYLLNGDYRKAIDLATRVLALDPTVMRAHRQLANAYFFLGDAEQLMQVTLAAYPEVPADILANESMRLNLARGDLQQAREILRTGVKGVKSGEVTAGAAAYHAARIGDFDTAGELLLQAYQ